MLSFHNQIKENNDMHSEHAVRTLFLFINRLEKKLEPGLDQTEVLMYMVIVMFRV